MPPMRSVLRYAAVAAMIASLATATSRPEPGAGSGKWRIAEMPSQTAGGGGIGSPVYEIMATQAPALELVRRQLDRRIETNTCSEWTILGGNGYPVCYGTQTCLFSTVGNLKYEGCGNAEVAYAWITECYNFPKSGTAGPSQTFCNSATPSCGVFEFIFSDGITYSNFGCGTAAYSYTATLLAQSTPAILTSRPSSTASDGLINSAPSFSPTPVPSGGSSTPVGAIVGGVLGGIAVIAILGFIAWYCLRKRKQDKEKSEKEADAATAAAYHGSAQTQQLLGELDGGQEGKHGGGVGAFAAPLLGNHFAPTPDKAAAARGSYNSGGEPLSAGGSPLPVYGQQQMSSPSSQATELAAGTGTNVSELGDNRMSYQAYHPVSGGPPVQEMGEGSSSTGGINRRPVGGPTRQSGVDMNGAPLSGDYRPHELP